jgi:hypothetical protein
VKGVWTFIAFIGAAIGGLLLDGPTMLSNAEQLPSSFGRVKDSFLGWYFEDEKWTGRWSTNPETYVDQEDMDLSTADLRLEIVSKNGEIDGTIATKKICAAIPVFDYVLITGSISGNKAEILVFDVIGGRKQEFAKLSLQRAGVIMTVTPKEGAVDWFPAKARIAHHTYGDQNEEFHKLCKEEREAFSVERRRRAGRLLEIPSNVRRPVSELF